jgi:hypothetical protein
MTSIFRSPRNALERLIIDNTIFELEAMWQPTFYKKHTAAEVHMHRRTLQMQPEVWIPEDTNI